MQNLQNIFREYDIRGIFPQELGEQNSVKIGYLLGQKIRAGGGVSCSVGYDARTHSIDIFKSLARGLDAAGVKVLKIGIAPTPVGYFSAFFDFSSFGMSAKCGNVMITGSHNPPQYNGFKITIAQKPFFGEQIYSLGREFEKISEVPNLREFEEIEIIDLPALSKYIDFMCENFAHLRSCVAFTRSGDDFQNAKNCKKISIFYDCGNGVAALSFKEILARLEIGAKALYDEPDGTFPNHHPDPSEVENLKDLQSAMNACGGECVGFGFDGDADRIAVLLQANAEKISDIESETKNKNADKDLVVRNLRGDELAIIFAHDIAKQKAKDGKKPIIIGEVKCSLNMYEEIRKIGTCDMWRTGHSNLKVRLAELGADAAFELSGHSFFADRYFGYDDAVYAALRTLELVGRDGLNFVKPLLGLPKLFASEEIKIKLSEERKFAVINELKAQLKEIKNKQDSIKNNKKSIATTNHSENTAQSEFPRILEIIEIDGMRVVFENGWGLVRASNTTPVLVARFEAKTKEQKELYQNSLFELLNSIK